MELLTNTGFATEKIEEIKSRIEKSPYSHLTVNDKDNSDEYVNFYFVGMYEGKEVVYDTVMYTLRLHHNSELYEIAEHRAAKKFPEYSKIKYEEDENGDLTVLDDKHEDIGLFMAEVIMELEVEGEVKVKEHVQIDTHLDFGIGLDVALHVEHITPEIIDKFVNQYNEDALSLDDTLYSFSSEES